MRLLYANTDSLSSKLIAGFDSGGVKLAGRVAEIGGRLSLFTAHAWAFGHSTVANENRNL